MTPPRSPRSEQVPGRALGGAWGVHTEPTRERKSVYSHWLRTITRCLSAREKRSINFQSQRSAFVASTNAERLKSCSRSSPHTEQPGGSTRGTPPAPLLRGVCRAASPPSTPVAPTRPRDASKPKPQTAWGPSEAPVWTPCHQPSRVRGPCPLSSVTAPSSLQLTLAAPLEPPGKETGAVLKQRRQGSNPTLDQSPDS